jgi:hypothetical protein
MREHAWNAQQIAEAIWKPLNNPFSHLWVMCHQVAIGRERFAEDTAFWHTRCINRLQPIDVR